MSNKSSLYRRIRDFSVQSSGLSISNKLIATIFLRCISVTPGEAHCLPIKFTVLFVDLDPLNRQWSIVFGAQHILYPTFDRDTFVLYYQAFDHTHSSRDSMFSWILFMLRALCSVLLLDVILDSHMKWSVCTIECEPRPSHMFLRLLRNR